MRRRKDEPNELEAFLSPEQTLLFTALREEFNAKLGSLKAWGLVALVGGQLFAGLMTAWLGPSRAAHVAAMAAHLLT